MLFIRNIFISLLANAKLLNLVSYKNRTIGDLTKPDKVLLNNTNLSYLYGDNANIGSARETFFVNQLSAVTDVILAPQGDFMIDNYTFEVGGKKHTALIGLLIQVAKLQNGLCFYIF